jgi:hypothetical protein
LRGRFAKSGRSVDETEECSLAIPPRSCKWIHEQLQNVVPAGIVAAIKAKKLQGWQSAPALSKA